ncbi:MAG: GNAT family N-acetyltransferase [Acidobacteria bacterium]|nr:GNAT family N-acetyltransferase [Acidobacteriota bacterium]
MSQSERSGLSEQGQATGTIAIDRFRPEDRPAIEQLYRRVFGHDAQEASRLRWDWQYRRNPNNPPDGPQIWVARDEARVIGQYASMPVTLWVHGREIPASWGMDVMVAPERQRQGLGELLFRTWDRHTGASLGMGLSEASYRLFQKLRWRDVGPIPCLVKPLTRRALRRPQWSMAANRFVSWLTLPFVRIVGRARPLVAQPEPFRRFDASFTRLWERVAGRFDAAVKRDATYLNWKFSEPPAIRYSMAAVRDAGEARGYVVYRHLQEPRGRVTLLVDLLADPEETEVVQSLLAWVDREARANDSDKIRTFAMHAGFRKLMRRAGYFQVKSTLQFAIKINAIELSSEFFQHTDGWHFTLGDSDQDR